MTWKFYRTLLVLGWSVMGGVPLVSRAQGGPPRVGEMRGDARRIEREREVLERRFHERVDAIVKQRLRLTDEQHLKLRDVASRTEEARRALRRDELTTRMALRRELVAKDRADETKVADLLDQVPRLERRKLDLLESEQRELAKFLSPVQRARYFGLQDELRRGMHELQRRRMGGVDSASPGTDGRSMRRRGDVPPAG
ncbi:MAG: Spy/CpxP family protein refolding chaperone [Gemmatimonadota bacterium]|nr:Spy/CpxP family protein refolding chaperone [Gemmatimonadota bacterium]